MINQYDSFQIVSSSGPITHSVRVLYGGFYGKLDINPTGYKLEYLTDQRANPVKVRNQILAADGTVQSPRLATFGRPGLELVQIDRELTVNKETTVHIPETAVEVSIIDTRGTVSIVVDEKTLTRFKANPPLVLEKK